MLRIRLPRTAVIAFALAFASFPLIANLSPAASFRSKLATIQANETSRGPHRDVTLTAKEADAYFAQKGTLPNGVSNLALSSKLDEVSGGADVDFDKVQGSAGGSLNPLVAALFSGVHRIEATAHVDSANAPAAQLTVNTVSIDGETIPNSLVDWAIEHYVQPKHPEISRTFKVTLPKNVKSAEVGDNQVVLHY